MFSWGEDTNHGFGLRKLSGSNSANSDNVINFTNLRSGVRYVSACHSVVAFARSDGKVSVVRMREDQHGKRSTGKLKSVNCKENVQAVSCRDDVIHLLSEDGKVLYMDTCNVPRPLEQLCNKQVKQVACGDHHSIALTQDCQVFTWGMNSHGQLGWGPDEGGPLPPRPLRTLMGLPLVQVTAGGDSSFTLSLSGAVFGWGRNSWGQLGLGDTTDRHVPTPVTCLNMKKTVFIACGKDHTAVLTKGGVVFTFGCGRYGQLGHNALRDETRPRLVVELWGSEVNQIACGRHHTLVSVGSTNKVYSFGRGQQGQLGNGVHIDQSVPLPVTLSEEHNGDQKIEHIFAGGNHSFAMVTSAQESQKASNQKGVAKVRPQTLDVSIVDKLISKCDSTSWKKIQKEIKRIFSTESCVNGCFVDKSGDKHYQTSPKFCGLDMSLASHFFKKLVKRDKVITEVEAVVLNSLLPTLNEGPVGVEGLRVYLLLPELLRALQKRYRGTGRDTDLTTAVAAAILRLHPDKLQVLGDLWCSLERSILIKHIEVWKSTLSYILKTLPMATNSTRVLHLLSVLQHIHTATEKAESPQAIYTNDFCMEDLMLNPAYLREDVKLWRSWSNKQDATTMSFPIICRYPFLMNLQNKIMVLRTSTALIQEHLQGKYNVDMMWPAINPPPSPYFELRLRRASLVEDTFKQLDATPHIAFKKPLWVYFDGDSKVTMVYKWDFFLHVFDDLLAPESEMFMYNDTQTLAWFPAKPSLGEDRYFLFGVLCGLALYDNNIVHLPFPLALFKKLVNAKLSLEDLMEFSPVLAESLRTILEDYTDDVVESLDMTCSMMWDGTVVELDPKEPEKLVTGGNKREFVDAYVNHVFSGSVVRVFEEFRRGFFTVCDRDVVELFQPAELRGVMVGKENYDWEKLKQNTVYEGEYYLLKDRHPSIVTFWEVFEELTEDEKKAFLLFVTACDRVPILGMDQIRMRVRDLYNSSEHHFPEALTCHSILELPIYPSKEILQARLTEALHHNRGFWKEQK